MTAHVRIPSLSSAKREGPLRGRLEPFAQATINDRYLREADLRQKISNFRFGSNWRVHSLLLERSLLALRDHRVEPKLVAEITYLTWTADNLLRHTVYLGLREDKAAEQVRRDAARS